MALPSQSEIEDKITAIQAELDALVANPEVDYKMGNKSVSASQKQDQLMKQLEYWEKQLGKIATEDVSSFATSVDEFGQDQSDYVGED